MHYLDAKAHPPAAAAAYATGAPGPSVTVWLFCVGHVCRSRSVAAEWSAVHPPKSSRMMALLGLNQHAMALAMMPAAANPFDCCSVVFGVKAPSPPPHSVTGESL